MLDILLKLLFFLARNVSLCNRVRKKFGPLFFQGNNKYDVAYHNKSAGKGTFTLIGGFFRFFRERQSHACHAPFCSFSRGSKICF